MDLNLKHKIMNFLEGNRGENLGDVGFGNEFLDTTPKEEAKTKNW